MSHTAFLLPETDAQNNTIRQAQIKLRQVLISAEAKIFDIIRYIAIVPDVMISGLEMCVLVFLIPAVESICEGAK